MRETLVLERIHAGLSRLRLPRMAEVLEQVVSAAEKTSKSYLSFLIAEFLQLKNYITSLPSLCLIHPDPIEDPYLQTSSVLFQDILLR